MLPSKRHNMAQLNNLFFYLDFSLHLPHESNIFWWGGYWALTANRISEVWEADLEPTPALAMMGQSHLTLHQAPSTMDPKQAAKGRAPPTEVGAS